MGMFDDIICEYPLPDGYDKKNFQSKSFDCQMDVYKITADGELRIYTYDLEDDGVYPEDHFFKGEPKKKKVHIRWELVDYHGVFNFYGGTWSNELQKHTDGWHEYLAKFTDGKLVEITVAQPREIHQERKELLAALDKVKKEHP